MKLLVGLGNPGEKYLLNRHNVGFMFIDNLVDSLEAVEENRVDQKIAITFRAGDLILGKPQTFMNSSGPAVRELIKYYSLAINHLYVVHDDLDLKLGEYKIQKEKGPKLHNGINSIEQYLKSADFVRIRIGVDNRLSDARVEGEKYILENFSEEELKILQLVLQKATVNFLKILRDGK